MQTPVAANGTPTCPHTECHVSEWQRCLSRTTAHATLGTVAL